MATLVITLIIAVAVFYGLRSFIKGKGSCGDCNCSCPVKNEMHKAKK
ncbi:FeoB-associated Cys-rich membrane protein [Streptococcus orisratti]|nr:FeoB-associated Cys-rich membrane protein [Streptococcus orisratti]